MGEGEQRLYTKKKKAKMQANGGRGKVTQALVSLSSRSSGYEEQGFFVTIHGVTAAAGPFHLAFLAFQAFLACLAWSPALILGTLSALMDFDGFMGIPRPLGDIF